MEGFHKLLLSLLLISLVVIIAGHSHDLCCPPEEVPESSTSEGYNSAEIFMNEMEAISKALEEQELEDADDPEMTLLEIIFKPKTLNKVN
ncbi:uncharacterized protein Dana_GF26719 [Drosophila ananassae]|uniref:Uncharacterized protein n=1 Tax=Drosophila ananassae TaxID=7217 RepID=A0A0P8Y497_DROAN|nr:uncharacterized protein Dana_GF26719 [Drosophila ananassae]